MEGKVLSEQCRKITAKMSTPSGPSVADREDEQTSPQANKANAGGKMHQIIENLNYKGVFNSVAQFFTALFSNNKKPFIFYILIIVCIIIQILCAVWLVYCNDGHVNDVMQKATINITQNINDVIQALGATHPVTI